jgi:hypothetical protein
VIQVTTIPAAETQAAIDALNGLRRKLGSPVRAEPADEPVRCIHCGYLLSKCRGGCTVAAKSLQCPKCGAPAGEPCRMPNGKAYRIHPARYDLALGRTS